MNAQSLSDWINARLDTYGQTLSSADFKDIRVLSSYTPIEDNPGMSTPFWEKKEVV